MTGFPHEQVVFAVPGLFIIPAQPKKKISSKAESLVPERKAQKRGTQIGKDFIDFHVWGAVIQPLEVKVQQGMGIFLNAGKQGLERVQTDP
jgi:hypothetical protein